VFVPEFQPTESLITAPAATVCAQPVGNAVPTVVSKFSVHCALLVKPKARKAATDSKLFFIFLVLINFKVLQKGYFAR
jgi:hypothetical protein